MSTIDTSTWNPDPALNESIGDIPLNADASIQQTWQAIQMLMAAGGLHGLQLVVFDGATASTDGKQGLVPAPEAGDQDKFLKGDGTWDDVPVPNLGTASRAVQTDANGALAVSSVTATELGYLSGVTSAVQTQLDAKAADSGVVHLTGAETISGTKTFSSTIDGSISGSSEYTTQKISSANLTFPILICATANATANVAGRPVYFSKDVKLNANTGNIYANNIQTTSDERLKTDVSAMPDAVLDAWEDVEWSQFRMLEAVAQKGSSARLHTGIIAQRIEKAFLAHGLDASDYGLFCRDEGEDGEEMLSLVYTEAQAMEAAFQRRRADMLEARIKALEEKLNG